MGVSHHNSLFPRSPSLFFDTPFYIHVTLVQDLLAIVLHFLFICISGTNVFYVHVDGLLETRIIVIFHSVLKRGLTQSLGTRYEDRRPTTEDRRPKTNEQRPTTEARRPTTNDQRPKTNDQRPTDRQSVV